MSTKIKIWGEKGSVEADRQECMVYLREPFQGELQLSKGWTNRNTTELTDPVWYYLRGEEYSAQVAHFVARSHDKSIEARSDFRTALDTDRVVEMIYQEPSDEAAGVAAAPRLFSRFWRRSAGGAMQHG